MKKRVLSLLLAIMMIFPLMTAPASAADSDAGNGGWYLPAVTLRSTPEAELMVRVGDIDALNDETPVDESGYNPFTAASQYPHYYPWWKDREDPEGTDRIFVGSKWTDVTSDGYSENYNYYANGEDSQNAYGDGELEITMSYSTAGVTVRNALLQLCIDDFQPLSWGSNFTVSLNGKDAPFIAELLNHVDQTGPTAYIVSAIIPPSFYTDIQSGRLIIAIDETTGCGDGFAVDFVKLLVNYNAGVFKGTFGGRTEPGATVRLLGTSTTVTASSSGGFEFEAIPGLNAVRASKDGYAEEFAYGVVLAEGADAGKNDARWTPDLPLSEGRGSADIDFSQFGETAAWAAASDWAKEELDRADMLGLIPDSLRGQDLTKPITRAEFAAVSVRVYEALSGAKAQPVAVNPFTDTKDAEVLKAVNVGVTNGTSATAFEPNTLLNREQAATMLTRVYKKTALSGWTLADDSAFTLSYDKGAAFADDANISAWAKDSVYFMASKGIINGVGNNMFAPRAVTSAEEAAGYAQATREQALLIAARMVKNLK